MSELFKNIDCIEFFVADLDEGIKYYCDSFGLKLLWRAETSVGLGMEDAIAEIVLQTDRKKMNVDFRVESVMTMGKYVTDSQGNVIGVS